MALAVALIGAVAAVIAAALGLLVTRRASSADAHAQAAVAEVRPNGGSSFRDVTVARLDRLDTRLTVYDQRAERMAGQVDQLVRRGDQRDERLDGIDTHLEKFAGQLAHIADVLSRIEGS